MNMRVIKKIMNSSRWGMLATCDGKRVGVRPMSGWVWAGKEIWIAAGSDQDKIKHLSKVANAEFCFIKQNGEHVRINGYCTISRDNKEKLKLYQMMASLKEYVDGPNDPHYVIIRMRPTLIRWMGVDSMKYTKIKIS